MRYDRYRHKFLRLGNDILGFDACGRPVSLPSTATYGYLNQWQLLLLYSSGGSLSPGEINKLIDIKLGGQGESLGSSKSNVRDALPSYPPVREFLGESLAHRMSLLLEYRQKGRFTQANYCKYP